MSSNMQILKICEYCTKEFIAKKTTTKCCSDDCAKRFYKLNKRNDKIAQAELKTEIKRQPKAFITEDELRVIQAKQYLTLKEAAVLLNVSPPYFEKMDFRWEGECLQGWEKVDV